MAGRSKKKYFQNRWQEFKDVPSHKYEPVPYELFMDWRADEWQIKRSYICVIRTENLDTGRIKEVAYKRPSAAKKKVAQLLAQPNLEVTVCNPDALHSINTDAFITDDTRNI